MKIMFSWRKMGGVAGGVERFLSSLMNEMAIRGHDVVLLTWDQEGASCYYPLDNRVRWYPMSIGRPEDMGSWKTRFKRMGYVRSLIDKERPDVMLCFESGIFVSLRLFLAGYKVPMVSAERNSPSRLGFSGAFYKKYIVFYSLFLADKVTVQFERYRNGYPWYLRKRIVCIPNPVREANFIATPEGEKNHRKILLCVSRISFHQKNPLALVEAFKKIQQRFPDWDLVLAGDGDPAEEKYLTEVIAKLGLQERIKLLGAVKNVENLYKNAHLFCLPSRYEGFPNALAEALSHGLPCVGFTECAGVCDLIQNGVNGLLAEGNANADTLSAVLAQLMADDSLRQKMGQAAVKSMEIYRPKIVYDQWESFLQATAN